MESSVTYFSERRPCFATQRVMRLYLRLEMGLGRLRAQPCHAGGLFSPPVFRIFLGPACAPLVLLQTVARPDVWVGILLVCGPQGLGANGAGQPPVLSTCTRMRCGVGARAAQWSCCLLALFPYFVQRGCVSHLTPPHRSNPFQSIEIGFSGC